ncbi:MAG: hypothetical protein AMK72_12195 [Planctomycetes bacterium SM23_25]|nr:MAG: hypothetical protein AMK72_12195 [Planctomycetes bacterium SM23_25]
MKVKVPQASRLCGNPKKHSRDGRATSAVGSAAIATLVFFSWAQAAEEAVELARPVHLPHVGLTIALPADQKLGLLLRPVSVLAAQAGEKENWRSRTAVEVSRAWRGQRLSPRRMAEIILPKLQKTGGYDKSEFVAAEPARVENQPAWKAVRKFTKADSQVIGAVLVWTAPFPRYGLSLHYLVHVESNGPDVKKALRIASAVFASIRHIPLASPSHLDLPALMGPIADRAHGFAIGIPFGWHVVAPRQTGKAKVVFGAGVTDHIGGTTIPNVSVVLQADVGAGGDFNAMSEEGLERYLTDMRRRRARIPGWKYLSHRRVWIAGRTGVEMVGAQVLGTQQFVQIVRQVYDKGKLYTVGLNWGGDSVKRASAAMVQLSLSFRLLEPPPGPQTQPAPAKGD